MSTVLIDPFSVNVPAFISCPIPFAVTIYSVPPNPDGSGGTVEDISDWIFMFTLKKNAYDSDDDALDKQDWQIGASPAGATGQTKWEVSNAVTKDLTQPATYYWDLNVIQPTFTEAKKALSGTVGIQRTITLRTVPVL